MNKGRAASQPCLLSALSAITFLLVAPLSNAAMRSEVEADQLARQAVSQLTLLEKLEYISGRGDWNVRPLPRLGLPEIFGADGGVGLRYTNRGNAQGVGYPSGPSLAASFNPDIAIQFGRALAYDTLNGGYHYITAPGMNLARMPYAGRSFEYVSGEDPYLGATLATAAINGIQSRGAWADAKHYTANDQETNRFVLNEIIPERVLREISLPAFESSAKNGSAAVFMCAFQRVNGDFACESNYLLNDILKGEWGYRGFVQTDYNAIHDSLKAALAGTDIEMPTGIYMTPGTLTGPVESGQLPLTTVDDKVLRILRSIYRYGFDTYTPPTTFDTNSPASNITALSMAREGIVLLKNRAQILPFDAGRVNRIAVIGVLSKYAPPTGFGSAAIEPYRYISELSGLEQVAPSVQVDFLDGLSLDPSTAAWSHAGGTGTSSGLVAEYFTNATLQGSPAVTRTEQAVTLNWSEGDSAPTNGDDRNTSVRWTGQMTPTVTGEHVFKVRADGAIRLTVNGAELLNNGEGNPLPNNSFPPTIPVFAKVSLQAGQTYDVRLEYSRRPGYLGSAGGYAGVQLSWASLTAPSDLASYDAVVMAVGNSSEYEGEGFDHPWELPEFQGELIQSVGRTNPRTVVVMHGGTALKMDDWIDTVGGALHAFYPGQNGGQALAEILFGRANPSAKLPISLDRNIEDNPLYSTFPTFDNYGNITEISYENDLFIGYRGYDRQAAKALFPFGFGLSYTTFAYSDISVSPGSFVAGVPIKVSFNITNTGQRAGAEVAQVYVGARNPRVERPLKELKGYKKVLLQPGQTRRVTVELNDRAFAYYQPGARGWVVDDDVFTIYVGASSQDIKLHKKLFNQFRQQLSTTTSNPLSPATVRALEVSDRVPPPGFIFDQEVE